MAQISNSYVGDGTTVLYSFTFPYIDTTDLQVLLDSAVTTEYSLANATTVEFNTAPADGVDILIKRNTNVDAVKAQFFPGSVIRAQDLNDNFEQNLFVIQEGVFDAGNAADLATAAQASANAAQVSADAAQATADTGVANAATAQSTADTAVAAAAAAQSTADSATTSAATANTTANAALPKAGGTMTGPIVFSEDQTGLGTEVSSTPPSDPLNGDTWWDSSAGKLYVYYQDVDSSQWVEATPDSTSLADDSYTYPGGQSRTISERLQDYVSVKDFGAVGDGVTDDTAAIQAALNSAPVIIFPPGIYGISATLNVPNNTRLQGEGSSAQYPNFTTDWVGEAIPSWGFRATTIQRINSNGPIFDNANYCEFDSLVIRNPNSRDSTDIVIGGTSSHFKMTDCVIQNMASLLPDDLVNAAGGCLLDSCQFTAMDKIARGAIVDAKVQNCTFTSLTDHIFVLTSGAGLNSFVNNRFDFCGKTAIKFETGSRTNRVIGNNFDAHETAALRFDGVSDRNIISNNAFWRCGWKDTNEAHDSCFIRFFDSSNQLIEGNSFVRGGPDEGNAWEGPQHVIGLESCIGDVNVFRDNALNNESCFSNTLVADRYNTSTGCLDIDQVFVGDDGTEPFKNSLDALSEVLIHPTICYIYSNKTVVGYGSAGEHLILTGYTDGITLTNSSGVLYIGNSSQLDNLTYGGLYYKVIDGKQYADGSPNDFQNNGRWELYRSIYYTAPSTHIGTLMTVSGSPDTWKTFGAITQ